MNEEQARFNGQLIAKCWSDADFKARLLADPDTVLAAEGMTLPQGVTVRVMENTPTLVHWILPAMPADGELSDESLEGVAGGVYYCCLSGCMGY